MALRFDIFRLDEPRRDQNGYLEADAALTRTGVFVYRHPDGSVTRELRHPDEVFKPESLSTITHRPVTDGHPIEGKLDATNTRRLQRGAIISGPKVDGKLVRGRVQITDDELIGRVLDEREPMREVSMGYEAEVVKMDGEFEGERYDHVQRNIVYNHAAVVRRGRAGAQVRLMLDAEDATAEDVDAKDVKMQQREITEDDDKVTINVKGDIKLPASTGVTVVSVRGDVTEQEYVSECMGDPQKVSEFPDEKQRAAVCHAKFRERGDAISTRVVFDKRAGWDVQRARKWLADSRRDLPKRTAKMTIKIHREAINTKTFKQDALQVELDDTPESAEKVVETILARHADAVEHIRTMEADAEKFQGRLDEMKRQGKMDLAKLNKHVEERLDAMQIAHYLGMRDYEDMETDKIKRAIVECASPDTRLDELTESYIEGRYDQIRETVRTDNGGESLANLQRVIKGDDKNVSGNLRRVREDGQSPREKFIEQTSRLWAGEQKHA